MTACPVCSGCRTVQDWSEAELRQVARRCPACLGEGEAPSPEHARRVTRTSRQMRGVGRTAPSYRLALDAGGYCEYVDRCRAAQVQPARQDVYTDWLRERRRHAADELDLG